MSYKILKKLLFFTALIIFFIFLFKIQMQRVSSFGCFDDCFSYITAFFMLKGKELYLQIFSNHQMLATYISFIIQKIFLPSSIYHLVMYHRIFIFIFSLFFDCLIIWRFRKLGIAFVIVYELTKHYLFGDRFLGEAISVYPFVYLLGLVWDLFEERKVGFFDYILSGFFVWFAVFLREPYVPLGLFILVLIVLIAKNIREKIVALVCFLIPTLITLFTININAYIFNVFYVNSLTVAKDEISSQGDLLSRILKITAYPVWAIIQHKDTLFASFLLVLSVIFLVSCIFFFIRMKFRLKVGMFVLLIILSLANLRFVYPGTIYYEAFHMIVWYGLFLMAILLIQRSIFFKNKPIVYASLFILAITLVSISVSPSSYFREKVDRQAEFVTNYGNYVSNGDVIRILSKPSDNVFLDGHDDMIYWEADRISKYKYSLFTSVMPSIKKYAMERDTMLKNNPPDFYFGFCPDNSSESITMPVYLKNYYSQIYFSKKPTCLYVSKKKITQISKKQWKEVSNYGYYLP